MLVCEVCDKTFSLSSSLVRHRKEHVARFLCSHCGKIFSRGANRDRHQSICKHRFYYPGVIVSVVVDDQEAVDNQIAAELLAASHGYASNV